MARKVRPSVSTAIRLAPADLNTSTPQGLAMAYAIGASDCLADARALRDARFADRTGRYMIILHAIELGLKAFLVGKNVTEGELRTKPFGHNLVELLNAAKARGLTLKTAHADELIDWINEWHFYGVKIRYEFTEDRSLPACEVLMPLAEEIIHKTTLPEPATVDRVSPLDSAGRAIEVYSVPIKRNAVDYARWIVERIYVRDVLYRFDLKNGNTFFLTGAEILDRSKP
jgi:hypothetical protein